jgi:preprotein translocase subunit SecY
MQIFQSFQNIFKIPELRSRLLWTFGLLIVFRLGSHVPLPGVNPDAIQAWREQMERDGQSVFHLVQVFSGGSIGNLAIFSLGIMPYITASIILQLMTKVSPNLDRTWRPSRRKARAASGRSRPTPATRASPSAWCRASSPPSSWPSSASRSRRRGASTS